MVRATSARRRIFVGRDVFTRPLSRRNKQDKSRIWLYGRHSSASNGVITEAEEATALEAVTRR
jgi:hypothetical protein